MTTTVTTNHNSTAETATSAPPDAGRNRRPRWPLLGVVAGVSGFLSVMVSMPNQLSQEDYDQGIGVVDELNRGPYHAGFVLGLISIVALLATSQAWKRWAEDGARRDLTARTLANGFAVTATINVLFTSLMGSMALYLPGGADEGVLSDEGIFTNFTLLDFGSLLGWWGAAISAVSLAILALRRRQRLFPRWMGLVSVVLLLPAIGAAVASGLPGVVGLTMPIWLIAISLGMVNSKRVHTIGV